MASKLSQYFILVIFVSMMASLLFVYLYAPNPQDGQQPGQPTPTPQGKAFRGYGQSRATIEELGVRFLITCTNVSDANVKAVESLEGMATVFKGSANLLVGLANSSHADAVGSTCEVGAAATTFSVLGRG